MTERAKKKYDWYKNPVVEDMPDGAFDYVMTQEMVDQFAESMDDPNALFPTIAGKHDGRPKGNVYESEETPGGGINARTMQECFNPPIPGQEAVHHRPSRRQISLARLHVRRDRGHLR